MRRGHIRDKKVMHERILVIDDEEHMLALFESVLRKEGYVVECSGSAEDALHVLTTRDFDLTISDLLLPGMDGLALLRRVKGLRPTLPYVLLTGYGTVRSAVEAMKKGATDYLTKPVDTDELKVVITKAPELHRLTREAEQLRAQVANGRGFPHIIESAESLTSALPLPQAVSQAHAILDNAEREKLRTALTQANGNRSRAAKVPGISRSTDLREVEALSAGHRSYAVSTNHCPMMTDIVTPDHRRKNITES